MSSDIKFVYSIIDTIIDHKFNFYIGQTDLPDRRLSEHFKDKQFLQLIVVVKHSKDTIDYLEKLFIHHYFKNHQCLNTQDYPKNPKSPAVFKPYSGEDHFIYIALPDVIDVQYLKHLPIINSYYSIVSKKKGKNNKDKTSVTVVDYFSYIDKINHHEVPKPPESDLDKFINIINKHINRHTDCNTLYIGKTNDFLHTKYGHLYYYQTSEKLIKQLYKCSDTTKIANLQFDLISYFNKHISPNVVLLNHLHFFSKPDVKHNDDVLYMYLNFDPKLQPKIIKKLKKLEKSKAKCDVTDSKNDKDDHVAASKLKNKQSSDDNKDNDVNNTKKNKKNKSDKNVKDDKIYKDVKDDKDVKDKKKNVKKNVDDDDDDDIKDISDSDSVDKHECTDDSDSSTDTDTDSSDDSTNSSTDSDDASKNNDIKKDDVKKNDDKKKDDESLKDNSSISSDSNTNTDSDHSSETSD